MRTWFALASMMMTVGCGTVLADGDHLDASLRGDPNIVGGQNAPADVFTYQVSIQTPSGSHFCGGSVIDEEWILTAAHCVVSERASNLRVETGILRLSERGETLRVDEIIVHPSYNSRTSDNDIALLRLSSPTSAPPVTLVDTVAEDLYATPGTASVVSGWGTLSSNGSSPDTLQYVEVPLLSNAECEGAYGRGQITDNMVCAGFLGQGGADSCQGDSGGPLVVSENGRLVQNGVVSFGIGCATARYPGVYTRISQYEGWISGFAPGVSFVSDGGGPTVPPDGTSPVDPTPTGDDHGNSRADATVVTVDGTTTLSAQLDAGDTDVFRLEIGGDGALAAFTTGTTDTFGTFTNASGSVLATDDDGGQSYNFSLTRDVANGDVVYLEVRGYDRSTAGTYTLTIDGPSAAAPQPEPEPTVDVDVSLDVSINASDSESLSATLAAGALDYYMVEVKDDFGSSVVLSASSTGSTDTFGTLYDANGAVLASNDDSNGSLNFGLSARVAPGLYLLEVRGYSSSISGSYGVVFTATR